MTMLKRIVPATTPIRDVVPSSGFDGLFFSRTDDRGVIRAFNERFLQVSEFLPEDVIGAPHRLVRHADMPKGLFHMFWNRLKANRPVGAYVKNRTKSGGSYWVFAVALPLPSGGYISVRLSPMTAHLDMIQRLYTRIRAAENEEKLSPETSMVRLLEALADEGYANYDSFEARALSAELSARAVKSGADPDRQLSMIQSLFDAAEVVRSERQDLLGLLDILRLVPTNMRLISHRIEKGLGPLSTLSERYGAMADTLLLQLASLTNSGSKSAAAETEALFYRGIATLLNEAAQEFAEFKGYLPGVDIAEEKSRLLSLAAFGNNEAQQRMVVTARSAARLSRELEMLNRSILALESIRVMSRVEFGQMALRSRDLAAVIQKIDESHRDIRGHLGKLSGAVLLIEEIAGQVLRRAAADL